MGSCIIVYVGIYALIYQHTILGEGIVSRDGLPRGVLPSGILKMRKKCPGLKVPCSKNDVDFRFVFYCESDDIIEISKSELFRIHGNKV